MCSKVEEQPGAPCVFSQRSYLLPPVLLLLWRPRLPSLLFCLDQLLSGTPAPPARQGCSCLRTSAPAGSLPGLLFAQLKLQHIHLLSPSAVYQRGEGNGSPLQYSCLEDPVDRGTWWAAVHRVAQSWTRLKQLSMHACFGEGNGNPLRILAWRSPGPEDPGGLPSMGSHRVRHDWSDLAAAYQRGFLWAAVKLQTLHSLPSLLSLFWLYCMACWTSPTRDWTCVLCFGGMESYPLGNQGTPLSVFLSFSLLYLLCLPKGKVHSLRTGTLSCSPLYPQDL